MTHTHLNKILLIKRKAKDFIHVDFSVKLELLYSNIEINAKNYIVWHLYQIIPIQASNAKNLCEGFYLSGRGIGSHFQKPALFEYNILIRLWDVIRS